MAVEPTIPGVVQAEAYSAARWFVAAIIVRVGWEIGGWIWMKLAA